MQISPAPANSWDLPPQVKPERRTGPEAATVEFLHSDKSKGEISPWSLNLLCPYHVNGKKPLYLHKDFPACL